jgi:hypothetical protein
MGLPAYGIRERCSGRMDNAPKAERSLLCWWRLSPFSYPTASRVTLTCINPFGAAETHSVRPVARHGGN